jgi:hypothetical protein
MTQRSAHFSRPGAFGPQGFDAQGTDNGGDATDPTFATSMIGFGGVTVAHGGHPAQ